MDQVIENDGVASTWADRVGRGVEPRSLADQMALVAERAVAG